MLNFAVGPVQMSDVIRSLGAEQVPYFRTTEFSDVMLENESLLNKLSFAPAGSRSVFLTGSGTAGMEAAVMNLLDTDDRALVVEGGSFGRRFVSLCELHDIPHEVIHLEPGCALTEGDLAPYDEGGFSAFIVNLGETSTGVLYDLDLIGSFCCRNDLFLLVDAVSAFLADPIDMERHRVGAMIVGSQKALAVPPGVSALVLDPNALQRVRRAVPKTLYFNLQQALDDGERGQTPFTPAVGVLLQINERLRQIDSIGLEAELTRVASLAADFRSRIEGLPFTLFAQSPSHAVTSLATNGVAASRIVSTLKDEYDIWVCPNGGSLAESVFRVGHIGALTKDDNVVLAEALHDMSVRGLLEARSHVER